MKYFSFIFFLVLIASCKEKENTYSADRAIAVQESHPGKTMLETYCYACHDPEATMDERLAPPMVAVKMHYLDEDTSKEEFLETFTSWMKEPSEDKSKMPGALRKFGLMPYTPYPDDVIQKIGDYLFEFDIESPERFEEHRQQEKRKHKQTRKRMGQEKGERMGDTSKNLEERGMEIAMSTKGVLGKNLIGTIKKKGTAAALEFCNLKAFPLTDSMSTVHQATIKRVSDRYRNPDNKANEKELAIIEQYKKIISEGSDIKPILDTTGEQVSFYYPIVTNDLCLQCHGIPNKSIKQETLKSLSNLYPNDLATGYQANQVRGIWSIQFDK